MKIIYFCPEYYSRAGGRAHARGFFGALGNLSTVSGTFLYPKSEARDSMQSGRISKAPRRKLRFLPPIARRVIQFSRSRPALTKALIKEIQSHDCDVLVIRTGVAQPGIRNIKKACPDTLIYLEINAVEFDEVFSNLPFRSVFQRWEVKRYKQAHAISVVSSYLKSYLEKRGISPETILVNQNGVDASVIDCTGPADLRKQHGIPEDAFLIGYIGGMEAFRRLPEVIGYIAELRREGNEDVYFFVIGDGTDMPAVQAAIKADGDMLKNTVKCVGWVDHSEIPHYLAAFDLAVFPFTNAYCSPLKLFEYLAAGVPTIGPDTPTTREVFEDGKHLKLVNQDGSDFVRTVLDLKTNPQLRVELSRNGQQLVLNDYTWEKNAERVVRHIQSIRSRWFK